MYATDDGGASTLCTINHKDISTILHKNYLGYLEL